eukprot:s451_g5.t3
MFGTLAAGGRILLGASSPTELRRQLATASFWDSAPAVLQLLERVEDLRDIRTVFLSGDWVPLALVRALRSASAARIVALGGATEATVWSNFFDVVEVDPKWRSVPYGNPIWNHQYYVLDESGRSATVALPGMAGQLYIAGEGVALGYIGQPQLTAESFRDAGCLQAEGAFQTSRAYRTGDLVRFVPRSFESFESFESFDTELVASELVLEFLGRADFQVKLRGHRVELGEIEQACCQAKLATPVSAAIVLAASRNSSERRLVAFVAPQSVDSVALRETLRQQLPAYMVPDTIVTRSQMPLTSSGKIDRDLLAKSLEVADSRRQHADRRQPATEMERHVLVCFKEALGMPSSAHLGVDDDFFELGGQSMAAMRLQGRLQQLSLQDIFTLRTAERIAEKVGKGVPIVPEDARQLQAEDSTSCEAPASFGQERFWLLERLQPGTGTYGIQFAYRLEGPGLQIPHLARALEQLTRRHAPLRTGLFEDTQRGAGCRAEPLAKGSASDRPGRGLGNARAASRLAPWLWLHDLRQSVDVDKEMQGLLAADICQGFDLSRGPLRIHLLRLSPESKRSSIKLLLFVHVHHVAFDGASLRCFEGDLWSLYQGPMTKLPVSFADAVARRQADHEVRMKHGMAYWLEELQGCSCDLKLPTDRPPAPAGSAMSGEPAGQVVSMVPSAVATVVRELAAETKTTEFAVLLAAYFVLLSRYCGQEDLLVGVPVSTRQRGEEALVADFVNTTAIRLNLTALEGASSVGGPTFQTVLVEVQSKLVRALEHCHVPWQVLVQELRSNRDLPEYISPVVQTMFDYSAAGDFGFHEAGLEVEVAPGVISKPWPLGARIPRKPPPAKFELSLDLFATRHQGYRGLWEFRASLFDAGTIRRLTSHWTRLPRSLRCGPVRELTFEPFSERSVHYHDFSVSRSPALPSLCVQDLIMQQAMRTPWSTAIIVKEQMQAMPRWRHICFRELRRAASSVASALRKGLHSADARTGARVGLLLGKGAEFVPVLLGTLILGCSYVPLSVELPAQRLRFLATDAALSLVLACPPELQKQAELCGVPVLTLSAEEVFRDGAPRDPTGEEIPRPCRPSSEMYVLYTSGSTGRPKGVSVSHHAVLSHILCCCDKFELQPFDRALQSIAFAFDFAVSQLYPNLVMGGSLCVPPEVACKDPAGLMRASDEALSTSLDMVPTLFSLVLETRRRLPAVRRINLGGEAVSDRLLHQSLKTFANARVLITYGPTEAAVDCTTWRLDKERLSQVPSAALGWPDTFRAVEVCAPSGAVPLGCPGELRIFGPGLAKGYVTAEETSKAFGSSHRSSGLQYRTGDAVRWGRISGLEFLGRLDAQVKVRGHRVELEEVESVLRKCPGIAEAAVVCATTSPGQAEARLVAFVTPQKGASSPTELPQSFAAKTLPDHMVPHHVFSRGLEDWPRSPTGKLDRPRLAREAQELLSQAQQGGSDEAQELPPDLRTAPAQHFVQLLRKILRLQKLALEKPFTRLGGDSISAIRVSAGLREQGYELAPSRLLSATSVAAVARSIEGCSVGCGDDASSSKLEGDVEMSSMQTRFFALGLHNPHHYNQSLMLVPSHEAAELDAGCFHRCLVRLAEHHDMLRASFPNPSSQRVRPHSEAEAAVSTRILRARLDEFGDVCSCLQQSLDLKKGPMMAGALVHLSRDGATEHEASTRSTRLLLVCHHLVVDLVSWQVIIADLEKILLHELGMVQEMQLSVVQRSFNEYVRPPHMPEARPDQTPEIAGATTCSPAELSKTAVVDWVAAVAKGPLDLATNTWARARRQVQSLDCAQTWLLLSCGELRPSELLLAALAKAFAQIAGAELMLWVDMEGHGRGAEHADFANTVGWFTELKPLCLEVSKSMPEALLENIERCRSSSAARGHNVQPTISFNYHGQASQQDGDSQLFSMAPEWRTLSEHDVAEENLREYFLEIEAMLLAGENGTSLEIEWIYHPDFDAELVGRFFDEFMRQIPEICECAKKLASSRPPLPSDFPSLGVLPVAALSEWLKAVLGDRSLEDVENVYPCTPLQEGMMAETLLDPRANVEQLPLLLRGVDASAWKRAWQKTVVRHEALRATIAAAPQPSQEGPRFWQVTFKGNSAAASVPWKEGVWDLPVEMERSGKDPEALPPLSPDEVAKLLSFLRDFLRNDAAAGFTSGGPLLRFALFEVRLEDGVFVFVRTEHHAISDGWSNPLLLQDALHFYEGGTRLAPAASLASFAAFVQLRSQGKRREEMRRFWRQHLSETGPPAVPAPADHNLQESSKLQLRRRLRGWSKHSVQAFFEEGATSAAVLHSAWAFLLAHRRMGDVFGAVLSGRHAAVPGVEGMVGLLISTVPLRARIPIASSCRDFVLELQQLLLDVTEHQYCNLAHIREWCELTGARDLFQTTLVYENFLMEGVGGSWLEVLHPLDESIPITGATLPMVAMLMPAAGDEMELTLRFDASLYTMSVATEWAAEFDMLVKCILERPQMPCGELLAMLPILQSAGHADVSFRPSPQQDDWISAWAPLLASQAAVSGLPLCLKPARPASEASHSMLAHWAAPSQYTDDFYATRRFCRRTENFDVFLSHDWGTSRWLKLCSLAVMFNVRAASILSICVGIAVGLLRAFGVIPDEKWTEAFPLAAFYSLLFFWQHLRELFLRPLVVFLDRLCIAQHDDKLKEQGILGLAGFLDRSDILAVLWSPRYFKRAWCTYELGTFLREPGKEKSVRIMPVKLAPTLIAFCVCWQIIGFAADTASEYFNESGPKEWLLVGGTLLFIIFCGAPVYMYIGMGLIRLAGEPEQLQNSRSRVFLLRQQPSPSMYWR